MEIDKYLITGAGSGFGKNIAFKMAKDGYDVIATVEVMSQISVLEKEAKDQGIHLKIEKLDVTNPKDRKKAWEWDVDVLLNNAGIKEGGAVADIPEEYLRNQFEVNVFGPILLTQSFAKKMKTKWQGKIVFMSSVAGFSANPLSGPYAASKFAIEAFAESLSKEMQEFNVQVATINPGPYITGFNDREFDRFKSWKDNPTERFFDYEKINYASEQYDPEEVTQPSIDVLTGKTNQYRNVIPEDMIPDQKEKQEEVWNRRTDNQLGKQHETIKKAYTIEKGKPATDD